MEAYNITENRGFNVKGKVQHCTKCQKPVLEEYDTTTSRWRCEVCGEPFKPESNRQKYCGNCKDDVQREQCRERVRKHREKWPKEVRKCDKPKKGVGLLGPHAHKDPALESRKIQNELKRLRLA